VPCIGPRASTRFPRALPGKRSEALGSHVHSLRSLPPCKRSNKELRAPRAISHVTITLTFRQLGFPFLTRSDSLATGFPSLLQRVAAYFLSGFQETLEIVLSGVSAKVKPLNRF